MLGMGTLCLVPLFRRWLLSCCTCAILSLSLTLRSLLTALCRVLFFASSSLSSLPTLFFVISSPSGWSVLFLLVVFLTGIFLSCFLFFGVLPLSPCPPALLGTLPGRSSFCSLWRPLAGLGGFRLSRRRSSSGDDLFLSYLPEFRAMTETFVRPLPRSFPVRSLWDFVGSLPDELLLCSVRALRLYLSRTASLPSRPCSVFVSPRSPSRSLSKNALSFFIREVIAEAYSSAGRSLPSASSSSSSSVSSFSSSRPRSSLRAHGVHGVAASWWAFHRNAPSASILESATWSSPSVFSSFYLSDVQFSSSSGYGLGPLVAAGSVV